MQMNQEGLNMESIIDESKKIIEQLTERGESIPLELLHIQQLIEQIDKNAIRIANTLELMRKAKNDDSNINISKLQTSVRAHLCEQYAYISEIPPLFNKLSKDKTPNIMNLFK